MSANSADSKAAADDGMTSTRVLAGCVTVGIAAEGLLILWHPDVLEYFQRNEQGDDRWLEGMREFVARVGIKP